MEFNGGIYKDILYSKNLLVSFGGIHQNIGVPVFEFFKSLSEFECDKVFIRDLNQAWYQKGCDHKINSINKLTTELNNIIVNNNYESVTFIGNSMGAYAAILFGTKLNVNTVLAFAPQTFIDVINKLRYQDTRWKKNTLKAHFLGLQNLKFFDLKSHLKNGNNYKTIIKIYYSNNLELDKVHSERLMKCEQVELYPYKKGGHSLVRKMKKRGELESLIKSSFK